MLLNGKRKAKVSGVLSTKALELSFIAGANARTSHKAARAAALAFHFTQLSTFSKLAFNKMSHDYYASTNDYDSAEYDDPSTANDELFDEAFNDQFPAQEGWNDEHRDDFGENAWKDVEISTDHVGGDDQIEAEAMSSPPEDAEGYEYPFESTEDAQEGEEQLFSEDPNAATTEMFDYSASEHKLERCNNRELELFYALMPEILRRNVECEELDKAVEKDVGGKLVAGLLDSLGEESRQSRKRAKVSRSQAVLWKVGQGKETMDEVWEDYERNRRVNRGIGETLKSEKVDSVLSTQIKRTQMRNLLGITNGGCVYCLENVVKQLTPSTASKVDRDMYLFKDERNYAMTSTLCEQSARLNNLRALAKVEIETLVKVSSGGEELKSDLLQNLDKSIAEKVISRTQTQNTVSDNLDAPDMPAIVESELQSLLGDSYPALIASPVILIDHQPSIDADFDFINHISVWPNLRWADNGLSTLKTHIEEMYAQAGVQDLYDNVLTLSKTSLGNFVDNRRECSEAVTNMFRNAFGVVE